MAELLIGAHQPIAGGTPRAVEKEVGAQFLETPKDPTLDSGRRNLALLPRVALRKAL